MEKRCKIIYINNFIYVTSDEPIKEGDLCMNANNTVVRYRQLFRDREVCKKIVATTDKSIGLPEPSKEFLDVYIKAYNEGKKIEEVLVEIEERMKFDKEPKSLLGISWEHVSTIKIKPDNTIIIKKVKDSWSREEVETICGVIMNLGMNLRQNQLSGHSDKGGNEILNEWLEQNL